MRAKYDSILSEIQVGWDDGDWRQFHKQARVPRLLTSLHEAAHWVQRQTLVERILHLLTVRALAKTSEARTNAEKRLLDKVIACRRLLSPVAEGLAIYTQYDYFPSNFYIGAGTRSSYDAILEFLVARRGMINAKAETDTLDNAAWNALVEARLTTTAVEKKACLLMSPFLIGESHITGYLIIKAAIARARANSRGRFLHDGHLIPLLMATFYNCPQLALLILDDDIDALQASQKIAQILSERIQLILNGETFAQLTIHTQNAHFDFESDVAIASEIDDFREAQRLYEKQMYEFDVPIEMEPLEVRSEAASQVESAGSDNQTRIGERIPPVNAYDLLFSPHFGRLFVADVQIEPTDSNCLVHFGANGQRTSIENRSARAKRYGWIRHPTTKTNGRLTEAIVHMHGIDDDFYRMSIVSHELGLVAIHHDTDDYNIGHLGLTNYLEKAYRIDDCLRKIAKALSAYENADFPHRDAVKEAKFQAYQEGTNQAVSTIATGLGRNCLISDKTQGMDFFQDKSELRAYAAFSIAVRFGDFSFENKSALTEMVKRNVRAIGSDEIDEKTVLRFASPKKRGLFHVQKMHGRPLWWSFSCLL